MTQPDCLLLPRPGAPELPRPGAPDASYAGRHRSWPKVRSSTGRLGLLVLLSTWMAAAVAADGSAGPAGGLKACRAMADGAARLACYDRLADAAPMAGAAAPTAAAPVPAVERFGLPDRPAQSAERVDTVVSRLTGAFDGWVARQRFRLANGQVWEIADGSEAFYRLDSPKVEISRGTFGTFFMAVEGVSQTPRVRRVE